MTNIASGYSDLVAQILPLLSLDGNLTFEIIIFAFMNVALFLQYLHLYRSVWWLPHSYNSNAVVRTTDSLIHLLESFKPGLLSELLPNRPSTDGIFDNYTGKEIGLDDYQENT